MRTMRLIPLVILLFAPLSGWAQGLPEMQNLQEVLVRLFNEPVEEMEDFDGLLQMAREMDSDPNLLLEAELRYYLQTGQWEEVGARRTRLRDLAEDYPHAQSVYFQTPSALESGLLALDAIRAHTREEMERFESSAKEAFWQDPRVATMFLGYLVIEHQEAIRLANYRVPMDTRLEPTAGEEGATLAKLVEGKKAILLDFWATWCGPCIRLMPELQAKHEKLTPQEVAVVAVNTDDAEAAADFRKEREMTVTWLAEPESRPLSMDLQIDSIPRMVLLDPEGRVLFNGHPTDEALETALAELGVEL